jgi:hypothetical protein
MILLERRLNLPYVRSGAGESAARPPARLSAWQRWRPWVFAAALLMLVGYLLFAHGCHADEDTELLVKTENDHHCHGSV